MQVSPEQLLQVIGAERVENIALSTENDALRRALAAGCQEPCCLRESKPQPEATEE